MSTNLSQGAIPGATVSATTAGSSGATGTAARPPTSRDDVKLIGLVSLAHGISHFCQLLLAPLFPWLKTAFNVTYAELGLVLAIFFVTSCVVQALSGFVVDRFGPRPVLFGGLGLLSLATFGFAASTHYWMLCAVAVIAGTGNGVFHPVDYTLFNRKVSSRRLGHAYSAHGISGSLGWALAPAVVVPIAVVSSWQVAMASAGALAALVLGVLWWQRDALRLDLQPAARPVAPGGAKAAAGSAVAGEHGLAFLRLPAVWKCFGFFFFYAAVLSVVQAYAPESAAQLHQMPMTQAATCLTLYMVASAGGMVLGGFLAADPSRCEQVVGAGFTVAALLALTMGLSSLDALWVPVLFGLMGFSAGIAGPSRDLLVKRSAPENATGRVYGVVYAGLDIGQAVAPLVFGMLMDQHRYRSVWIGLAILQVVLVVSAFNVGRGRRGAVPVPA